MLLMLMGLHLSAEVGRDTAGRPLGECGPGRDHMGEWGIGTPGMSGLGNAWKIELWATDTLGCVLC